jgi:hypothetical protein
MSRITCPNCQFSATSPSGYERVQCPKCKKIFPSANPTATAEGNTSRAPLIVNDHNEAAEDPLNFKTDRHVDPLPPLTRYGNTRAKKELDLGEPVQRIYMQPIDPKYDDQDLTIEMAPHGIRLLDPEEAVIVELDADDIKDRVRFPDLAGSIPYFGIQLDNRLWENGRLTPRRTSALKKHLRTMGVRVRVNSKLYLTAGLCLFAAMLAGASYFLYDRSLEGDVIAETPPPVDKPPLPDTRMYSPTYNFSTGGSPDRVGTAFVVKSRTGKQLVLTAAHVLEPDEWSKLIFAEFFSIPDGHTIRCNRPKHVGTALDRIKPHESGGRLPLFNVSKDFAIWEVGHVAGLPFLEGNKQVIPLELADHEPRVNEWVWVRGRYRAKVIRVKYGTFIMQQHDKFKPVGMSGGPIYDASGKLIGNLDFMEPEGDLIGGATVGTIRDLLSHY